MLTIDVITLFPEVVAPFTAASIPGRAAAAGLVTFNLVQLRDFTHDRHATVDDYAYGGGAGMVLKPEPFFEAVESLGPTRPIVLLAASLRRSVSSTPWSGSCRGRWGITSRRAAIRITTGC